MIQELSRPDIAAVRSAWVDQLESRPDSQDLSLPPAWVQLESRPDIADLRLSPEFLPQEREGQQVWPGSQRQLARLLWSLILGPCLAAVFLLALAQQ